MDKKLRNLLVLAGVLVLLCVGYAARALEALEGMLETVLERTVLERTVREETVSE